MGSTPVRGVMFDLGGTLCDYSLEMGKATMGGLTKLGFDPAAEETMGAIMFAMADVSREYAARASYLHRDLFREQFVHTVAALGGHADGELLQWFDAENRAAVIEHLRPRADAASVLQQLRSRGIYCSVVSNADDDFLGPTLTRHGLEDLLGDWTSSEEAASCKPDPAIFSFALAKADLRPDEVLFVGDSIEHDIVGASAAGLRSVLVTNGLQVAPFSHGMSDGVAADYEVTQLTELIAIVDGLNGAR